MGIAAAFLYTAIGVLNAVLLINEVPDRAPDKKHGRRSSAALLYKPSRIAYSYIILQIVAIAILLFGALSKLIPATTLLALVSVTLLLLAFNGIRHYKSPKQFEKYMGFDVAYFLLFVCLLIAGIVI